MEWICRCGTFAADIDTRRGTRVVCYCNSCREFWARIGATGALDAAGGSDLFQVAPEQVRFVRGAGGLAWLRLTEKGPARWVTTCCNTPVTNTLLSPGLPFVTMMSHRFADPAALGPVRARVFKQFATGTAPEGGTGAAVLMWSFAGRALRSRLTGGWKQNPFFRDGKPIGPRREVA